MSQLRLTPAAHSDLDGIWTCTAQHWNVDQAETYVRSLATSMQLLASSPGLGRKIDDIRPGYLKFAVAAHVIFYRETHDGIEVIRILHQRMDVERHL